MTDYDDNLEPKSKSQKKREVEALQELGEALVKLSTEQLARFQLEDHLLEAIIEAKHISSNGAKRRQLQYIGKLMRSIDPIPIQAELNLIYQKGRSDTAHFHQVEQWRDRLIQSGDAAINEFIEICPNADRQHLRQLVRSAQQEVKNQQSPRHARLLFRYLNEIMP